MYYNAIRLIVVVMLMTQLLVTCEKDFKHDCDCDSEYNNIKNNKLKKLKKEFK